MSDQCSDPTNYLITIGFLSGAIVFLVLRNCYVQARMKEQLGLLDTSNSLKVKFDELQLIKKLGEGAYGEVHKARWKGKDVAVKVFNQEKFNGFTVTAFVFEVAILHELRHPNIVLFMGASFEYPTLAIITELLKYSLYDFIVSLENKYNAINRRNSISSVPSTTGSILFDLPGSNASKYANLVPWHDRIQILIDACHGMIYLHENGMLHHDLKSPNLLLGNYHNCKVSDFGMVSLQPGTKKRQLIRKSTDLLESTSRTSSAASQWNKLMKKDKSFREGRTSSGNLSDHHNPPPSPLGGALFKKTAKKIDPFNNPANEPGAGTPQWTAPEVIEGYEFTEKADVFSFGIIMAELVNLSDPYPGYSPFEVTIKVAEGVLRPKLDPSCPRDVREVIESCVAQDPKERPTFLTIGQQLEDIQQDWLDRGPPDSLSSKLISAHRPRRGSSLQFSSSNSKGSIYADRYGSREWWIDEMDVTCTTVLRYGEFDEDRRGEYIVTQKQQPKAKKGPSGRKMSLSVFSLDPKKKYGQSTSTSTNITTSKSKTQSMAGSLAFPSASLTGSLIFGFANKSREPSLNSVSPAASTPNLPIEAKPVRVKSIEISNHPDLIEKFVKEMDKRFALTHRNIELVLGGWANLNNAAIVSENCSNGTLRDVIQCSNCDSVRINELLEVVNALQFLHSKKIPIIHKDIRAENVLCFPGPRRTEIRHSSSPSYSVKLTGFMFDFFPKTLSKEEQKIGIPSYSPPEVILGEEYSVKSDIYSFGMLCWEILTGGIPFEGSTFQDVGRLVCMEQKRPEIPAYSSQIDCDEKSFRDICEMVEKCWQGNPAKRPSLDDIRGILSGVRMNTTDTIYDSAEIVDSTENEVTTILDLEKGESEMV